MRTILKNRDYFKINNFSNAYHSQTEIAKLFCPYHIIPLCLKFQEIMLLSWLPKNIPTTPSQPSQNPSAHIIQYAMLVGKLNNTHSLVLLPPKQEPLIESYYQGCYRTQTLCIKGDSHPLPLSVLEPHSLSRSCTWPQRCWSHIQRARVHEFFFSPISQSQCLPSENHFQASKRTEKDGNRVAKKQQNDRYAKCPERWMANIRAMD